jgi:cobalamin biosynthesis Mg chelatase CobN
MKLRRALVTAAATAALAPIALLSAPAAFADEPNADTVAEAPASSEPAADATTTPAESTPSSDPAPSTPAAEETKTSSPAPTATGSATTAPSASASATATDSPSGKPTETAEPTDEPSDGPGDECTDSKADISITGLPGKINRGSGWHRFSLNVANNSDSVLSDLGYFAGASADKAGENLFSTKKVQLQALNPDNGRWENIGEDGYAVGFVGYSDTLEPGYEVNIPMRINVTSAAPVGAAFSLGASIYGDADGECTGYGEVAYRFQIVGAGTDTSGTKPQEGGKVPVSTKPADKTETPKTTGTLAETGSSSMLPTVGLIGGITVVAGAGVVYSVRRRKVGAEA